MSKRLVKETNKQNSNGRKYKARPREKKGNKQVIEVEKTERE